MIPFPSIFTQQLVPLLDERTNRILGVYNLGAPTALDETTSLSIAGTPIMYSRHGGKLKIEGQEPPVFLVAKLPIDMVRSESYRHDSRFASLLDVQGSNTHSSSSSQPNVFREVKGALLEFLETQPANEPL